MSPPRRTLLFDSKVWPTRRTERLDCPWRSLATVSCFRRLQQLHVCCSDDCCCWRSSPRRASSESCLLVSCSVAAALLISNPRVSALACQSAAQDLLFVAPGFFTTKAKLNQTRISIFFDVDRLRMKKMLSFIH